MHSQDDPFLMLRPRIPLEQASKEMLSYFKTVRKASEWKRLGFEVVLNEYGLPLRGGSEIYEFWLARERDEVITDAIKTGKKALRHPIEVFEYVQAGCDLGDFANLPEDVKAYCMGNLLRISGDFEKALPYLQRAVALNPNEVRYFEIYYPLRLQLGDMSAIIEELEYYRNDMDSAVHSGRFDEWMKFLLNNQEYEKAKLVISLAETALNLLLEGCVVKRLYWAQELWWYESKKEEFQKKAKKYLEKIEKTKNRKKTPKEKKPQKLHLMIESSDVSEVIYNFIQHCFIGEKELSDIDLSNEKALFQTLETGPITQLDAHQLPKGQRRLFRELLTQYITFFEMNKELQFPPDFLVDSTWEKLGVNLLNYICHFKWPYPQILPK